MNSRNQGNEELKIFIASHESKCDECGENLGSQAWIMLVGEKGAIRLSCADLEHLMFLPSSVTALTRRAKALDPFPRHAEMEPGAEALREAGLLVEEQGLGNQKQSVLPTARRENSGEGAKPPGERNWTAGTWRVSPHA